MVVLGRRVPIGKLIKTTVQTVVFFFWYLWKLKIKVVKVWVEVGWVFQISKIVLVPYLLLLSSQRIRL